MEEEQKPIREEINELKNQLNESKDKKKSKKLKLPKKGKPSKKQLKKGYVGVLRIDENSNLTAEKGKIEDHVFQDSYGVYHAVNGEEMLLWEGKIPVIIQPSWKQNPIKVSSKDEKSEVYGQQYIMARMMADMITKKKKSGNMGNWILWIVLGVGAIIAVNAIAGGNLF